MYSLSVCRCGNVNWARRNDCNMCGHAKFAKVEFRTGEILNAIINPLANTKSDKQQN